ncbi:MAG: hypothetical protein R2867_17380 [Caldilineaceae bacterium]
MRYPIPDGYDIVEHIPFEADSLFGVTYTVLDNNGADLEIALEENVVVYIYA